MKNLARTLALLTLALPAASCDTVAAPDDVVATFEVDVANQEAFPEVVPISIHLVDPESERDEWPHGFGGNDWTVTAPAGDYHVVVNVTHEESAEHWCEPTPGTITLDQDGQRFNITCTIRKIGG